jgi:hypothetical protein
LATLFFSHHGIQYNELALLLTSRYRAIAGGILGITSFSHQKRKLVHLPWFQFFFYDSVGNDNLSHSLYDGIAHSYFLTAADGVCGER